ncbi:UNVERIFIED_CONTAM: cobalt-precorrin 5B C1-methyltransferase [Acetivibrio alkalicellulosi]
MMNRFVVKSGKRLRMGITTGTCATAATKASAIMLLDKKKINEVKLFLPGGEDKTLQIQDVSIINDTVSCCTIKDAGDDPDVTHGIRIYSKVRKIKNGIIINGGMGVGRVTRPGLPCKEGEAAINPVPRKMIINALQNVSRQFGYEGGFEVEIFVPEGERVAKKTFNERLGICGGISILGTTGIVEPMSETALIDTIKLEIDIRKANKQKILLLSPGNYGLDFTKDFLGLDIKKAVKISNYVGEALDYAVYKDFNKILLVGHVGKLVKIGAGVMNTHSKTADCRNEIFAAHCALKGCKKEVIENIMNSTNTVEIHRILLEEKLCDEVYGSILKKIIYNINYRLMNKAQVEVVIFSNENGILMKTDYVDDFIAQLRN